MGPKYEFTGETMNHEGRLLHEIRRLYDRRIGGWIEKEENLSQEGNCWVYSRAIVYDNAYVYGNAEVCSEAKVYDDAKVYGDAKVSNAEVYGHAQVYDKAYVFGNAQVYGCAEVYGNAEVYSNVKICGTAKIYSNFGNSEIYGDVKITSGEYADVKISCEEDLLKYNELKSHALHDCELKKAIQDFIYKVDDSNKLTTQTEYDSVDEFFSEPIANDVKLDTLIICAVDTKEPLIKLQKVKVENKTKFKFIVEITTKDGDDFVFRSIIKSQDQLNQLVQKTIDALRLYSKFNKYADDLENYL